jgi:hypothetical protein
MSRLRSEEPAIADPTDEIDTEAPCYALARSPLVTGNEELHPVGKRDPSLVHPDVLLRAQASDLSCIQLREHLGAHPLIDVYHNGLLGVVLPVQRVSTRHPFPPGDTTPLHHRPLCTAT